MELDQNIINIHKQIDDYSCIPMVVELVLKLLGKMPADSFTLQNKWGNCKYGNFGSEIPGITDYGVNFERKFAELATDESRAQKPSCDELFSAIKTELDAKRYVIIALGSGCNFHNYVIYDQLKGGEFCAITMIKNGPPEVIENVRERVMGMGGTDIFTYQGEERG